MQILPIDVTGLVAAILGISIVLVPVIGFTVRFALKPTVETLSRFFEHKELNETVQILERRMAFLEQQIEGLESDVRRVEEGAEFQASLKAPKPDDQLGPAQHPAP